MSVSCVLVLTVKCLACQAAGAIRGEKTAMIAHLIGQNACRHASDEARDAAQKVKDGGQSKAGKQAGPKRKADEVLTQPKLKVFKGINIPFKESEVD